MNISTTEIQLRETGHPVANAQKFIPRSLEPPHFLTRSRRGAVKGKFLAVVAVIVVFATSSYSFAQAKGEQRTVTGDEVLIFRGPGTLAGITFKVLRYRDKAGVGHATAFQFPPNDPKGNFEKLLEQAKEKKKRTTVVYHIDKNGDYIIDGVVILK